jgi:tryptophan synthase beta chain
VRETHSISAGLDYPGVGPEHAYLKESGRASYVAVTDALEAFFDFAKTEGIIPALEAAHALAFARRLAADRGPDDVVLVNLSGRGDKDIAQIRNLSS